MSTHAFSWMRGRAGRYAAALGAGVVALGAVTPAVARPLMAELVAGVSRWRGWSRVLTLAAAAAMLAVGLAATPAAAATASITLKPASGPPTTKVTVNGAGFGASETVAVDFSSAQVATGTTSSTGTFSETFTVPKSALPGKHPVTATGQTSGLSATQNFLVATNWAQFHFSPTNSGFNPYENVISPANVPGLKLAWTNNSAGPIGSSPAVASGVLYVGTQFNGLLAFSAAGTGCSGSPVTCNPLWTGTIPAQAVTSPAVAGGVVYVTAGDGELYAFRAAGCGAAACNPLWTGAIMSNSQSAPTVAGGVVYVTSGSSLYAFRAAGCGAATCNPLWTGTGGSGVEGGSVPAVSGGKVYVAAYKGVAAFSAAGCGAATCNPLWTGATNIGGISSPAVANGVAYVGTAGGLAAYRAAGCGAAACNPLWTFAPSGFQIVATPAVANGVVYVPDAGGTLYAVSTAGALLWTAASVTGSDPPAVADGVVYAAASSGALYAFSAAGITGCSGSPLVCTPLWTSPAGTSISSSPVVVNGMVYVGQWTVFSQYLLAFK
jgi:outer membrane protein assembly factor BamB